MDKQEKEDLVAECRRTINAGTQLQSTYREIALAKIARIALASLTAPPVKLPAPIGVFMFTSYVKKALDEAEIKYEVEE